MLPLHCEHAGVKDETGPLSKYCPGAEAPNEAVSTCLLRDSVHGGSQGLLFGKNFPSNPKFTPLNSVLEVCRPDVPFTVALLDLKYDERWFRFEKKARIVCHGNYAFMPRTINYFKT